MYSDKTRFPSKAGQQFKTEHGTIYELKYVCYQEEKCPETGNLHLQGYMEIGGKTKVSGKTLKGAFDPSIHWSLRQGTAKQASDYCKKKESQTGRFIHESGEISDNTPGKRNDLQAVADSILENKSLDEVAREHPTTWMRIYRGATELANRVQPPPEDMERSVFIFYGEAGTGKSSYCKEMMAKWNLSICCPGSNNGGKLSFEDYHDEQALFLDDYEENALSCQALKTLMDRYATKLPGRGVSRWARHTHVFITSNYPISQWFPASRSQVERAAIERRATAIWHCGLEKWELVGGSEKAQVLKEGQPLIVENPMKRYLTGIPASAANSEFVMAPAKSNAQTQPATGSKLADVIVKDKNGTDVRLGDLEDEDFGPIEISDNESELF